MNWRTGFPNGSFTNDLFLLYDLEERNFHVGKYRLRTDNTPPHFVGMDDRQLDVTHFVWCPLPSLPGLSAWQQTSTGTLVRMVNDKPVVEVTCNKSGRYGIPSTTFRAFYLGRELYSSVSFVSYNDACKFLDDELATSKAWATPPDGWMHNQGTAEDLPELRAPAVGPPVVNGIMSLLPERDGDEKDPGDWGFDDED
jgi:hypothetical protein